MSFHKPAIMALLLTLAATTTGCWIPLPEETAIVVEVFDARGGPVNGVSFILDGSETVITGTQFSDGQVFKSLSVAGLHYLQMEMDSLTDPQGGTGWVPLASQVSGESVPLSFANRPFAGGSDLLTVPVNKGEITVVSVYLDDLLKSPADNQWLTDGLDSGNPYRAVHVDEFAAVIQPTFWWRQDPSLGATVNFTFQLWEDDDGDTRYPLGIADHVQYGAAMNPANAAYRPPDWQVPLAGIQGAESASTVNQVVLWASQAFDGADTPAMAYDLYYAPASHWNGSDYESNPVLRDLVQDGPDGSAIRFHVGNGTSNDGLVLKNGVPYTFALAARDEASNLDTVTAGTPRGERMAVPREVGNTLGSVSGLAITDTTDGTLTVTFNCAPSDSLRIYAAPRGEFNARPFDPRFIRDEIPCPGSYVPHNIEYLLSGVRYSIGIEPFDSDGNVGVASSIIEGTPAGSLFDTVRPAFLTTPGLVVDRAGLNPGEVRLTIAEAADSASLIRRVYWAPDSFTNNTEAMPFFELQTASPYTTVLTNIPSGVPYNYVVRAIDEYGNSSIADSRVTIAEPADTTGPAWASDDQSFYTTFSYAAGSTVWPLGATWKYEGFALGQDPQQGKGEYVWRVVQENPDRGVARPSKLGAFYTYSGYYYAATDGSLSMSSASANVAHQNVFSFVESAVSTADVMGSPFDSGDSAGFKQRTAAGFAGSLAAGSSAANQLRIIYNTDEDGVAVVIRLRDKDGRFYTYAGILKVQAVNKRRPLPTPEPHLQGKEFQLSYFETDNDLATWPEPLFGGGIDYFGTLDEPDYQDPLW